MGHSIHQDLIVMCQIEFPFLMYVPHNTDSCIIICDFLKQTGFELLIFTPLLYALNDIVILYGSNAGIVLGSNLTCSSHTVHCICG